MPEQGPAEKPRRKHLSGAQKRKLAKERARLSSLRPGRSQSLPPGAASEVLLAGQTVEEALSTEEGVRAAMARLAVAAVDGVIDRTRANSATFILNGVSQLLGRQAERQQRERELGVQREQVEQARALALALEEHRERRTLLAAANIAQHLSPNRRPAIPGALEGDAAADSALPSPADRSDGEVEP